MTQKNMKKLVSLVENNTQKEAVYAFLATGQALAASDAEAASIKDPRRVVNKLRTEHGVEIESTRRTLRNGSTTTVYSLGGIC